MSRAVLHYHKCRCCDKDCICVTVDCAIRATDRENNFVCFRCQQDGEKLIEQFKAAR